MAKCIVCDKATTFGNNVSHSHRRSNKAQKANIRKVKAVVDGSAKKVDVCSRCLRSGKIERA
ncbi:MAG: 50S ribosomal protein L28 [Clostridia bacterium]|jgi:large subunit ribosomal protein L28|nr:50S ribosomal protein L28 [Clostridia bacterium]